MPTQVRYCRQQDQALSLFVWAITLHGRQHVHRGTEATAAAAMACPRELSADHTPQHHINCGDAWLRHFPYLGGWTRQCDVRARDAHLSPMKAAYFHLADKLEVRQRDLAMRPVSQVGQVMQAVACPQSWSTTSAHARNRQLTCMNLARLQQDSLMAARKQRPATRGSTSTPLE